jgi:hypothetical protein
MRIKQLCRLLLLCALIPLQGCFDIVEQLTLNSDGSGSLRLVLNLSKSRTKVQSVMKMKTVNGHRVPQKEEIRQQLAGMAATLKSTPGISQVKSSVDFSNFIATMECRFSSVQQLNNAALKVAATHEWKQDGLNKLYSYQSATGLFTRLAPFTLEKEYRDLSNADREIFATAIYTGIFRFDRAVKKMSNPKSKRSADSKAVMLQSPMTDIITGKQTIDNTIQLTL